MTLLVDSSVWIDYLHRKSSVATDYLDARLDDSRVVVGDLVLTEVLQGVRSDREMRQVRDALLQFSLVNVVGRAVAFQAAQNYRALRARGITIRKTIDCLIATRCLIEGWQLLYQDRDFEPFVAHLGLRSALAEAA